MQTGIVISTFSPQSNSFCNFSSANFSFLLASASSILCFKAFIFIPASLFFSFATSLSIAIISVSFPFLPENSTLNESNSSALLQLLYFSSNSFPTSSTDSLIFSIIFLLTNFYMFYALFGTLSIKNYLSSNNRYNIRF